MIGLHAVLEFLHRTAIELRHGHGGHAVLHIDGDGLAKLYVAHILNGGDEVERDFPILYPHVLGVEVTLVAAVGVGLHPLLHIGPQLQVGMDDERAPRLDEFRVVAEAFQIGFLVAIYVEVVGVCGRDDAHPRTQPMEGAVELVGLDDHEVALVGEDVVGAVILGYATQERVAVDMALVHDVGAHGGSGGLAVCAGEAESLVGTGQGAQHLGALLYGEPPLAEEAEFLVRGGDGGSEHHQACLRVAAGVGYLVHVLLVVDEHALLLQLAREGAWSLVVAGHHEPPVDEVAGDGAHADATCPNEINSFNIFQFHFVLILLLRRLSRRRCS